MSLFENRAAAFKIISSYAIGTAAILFCLWTAWTKGAAPHLQVMICILGGALGWILGLYITPSNEGEKKQFSEFGKTLTALASGFGLAYIKPLSEWLIPEGQDSLTDTTMLRILLFFCALLIAGLFTYISRLHVRGPEDVRRDRREEIIAEVSKSIEKLRGLN